MRYQGRITEWKDDRGFGFIMPNGGGARIFFHIRAFQRDAGRPIPGELVTYEVVSDPVKGPRAEDVRYVAGPKRTPVAMGRRGTTPARVAAAIVLAVGAGVWYFKSDVVVTRPRTSVTTLENDAPQFACRGKRYCSEMTSCAEATFYLRHCPGVEIDGDHDGVPCESQWCSR